MELLRIYPDDFRGEDAFNDIPPPQFELVADCRSTWWGKNLGWRIWIAWDLAEVVASFRVGAVILAPREAFPVHTGFTTLLRHDALYGLRRRGAAPIVPWRTKNSSFCGKPGKKHFTSPEVSSAIIEIAGRRQQPSSKAWCPRNSKRRSDQRRTEPQDKPPDASPLTAALSAITFCIHTCAGNSGGTFQHTANKLPFALRGARRNQMHRDSQTSNHQHKSNRKLAAGWRWRPVQSF